MHGPGTTTDAERTTLRVAAISGLLYAAGAFVPQLDGPPVETASADEIRAFLVAHDGGLRVLAASAAIAIPLILVFTTSLARLIRLRAPGSPLADLVVGGGVLVAVWHWLVAAGSATTVVQALDGFDLADVDDATLRGWYGLTNLTHVFADLGMAAIATVMGAASLAALRHGLLPRWAAWLGIVCAVGGGLGTLGVTLAWQPLSFAWFVGIFGWFVWSFVVGVTCVRRARRAGVGAVGEVAV